MSLTKADNESVFGGELKETPKLWKRVAYMLPGVVLGAMASGCGASGPKDIDLGEQCRGLVAGNACVSVVNDIKTNRVHANGVLNAGYTEIDTPVISTVNGVTSISIVSEFDDNELVMRIDSITLEENASPLAAYVPDSVTIDGAVHQIVSQTDPIDCSELSGTVTAILQASYQNGGDWLPLRVQSSPVKVADLCPAVKGQSMGLGL